MRSFHRWGIGLSAAILALSASAFSADLALSGTVYDKDNKPLPGVEVKLAQAGLTTNTDAIGAWSLSLAPTGIGMRHALPAPSSHLLRKDGKLSVRYVGRDISGRGQAALPIATEGIGVAARIARSQDTLLYSMGGTVRLRDTVTDSRAGMVRILDTTFNASIIYGYLTDARDGQTYRTVKIGTQVWMAENLNRKVDSSWCYNDSAKYCNAYGRLYKWAAAIGLNDSCNTKSCISLVTAKMQGICPSGWHVPRDAEWTKLTDTTLIAATASAKLRANSSLWIKSTSTDDYGFHGLPSGFHAPFGTFDLIGQYGYCWSASVYDAAIAYGRYFNSNSMLVGRNIDQKTYSFSLRCLQD